LDAPLRTLSACVLRADHHLLCSALLLFAVWQANTVDFFNEISLLYGLIADDAAKVRLSGLDGWLLPVSVV
jgi:hypothetical protein